MGYFRILYYISYIFNTITRIFKRHGKFLIWFICIFVFLFFTMYSTRSHAAYEGDYSYGDPNYAIFSKYNNVIIDFIRRVDNSAELKQIVSNYILTGRLDYYIYYGNGSSVDGSAMLNGGIYNTNNIYIVFFNPNNAYSSVVYSGNYTNYYNVDCLIYDITFTQSLNRRFVIFPDGSYQAITIQTNDHVYVPSMLFHYASDYFNDYFINNYTLEEIEILHEMDNKIESIDNTINQTNEFLNEEPSDEDFSSEDLPSDSGVVDTTEDYTNTIFTDFYNTMTASYVGAVHDIEITIPFTNKTFKISGNYTKNYLPSGLKDLISMFWYFAISILIYRDLMHKFNKIRSGDIEHVQDNNIKEDML